MVMWGITKVFVFAGMMQMTSAMEISATSSLGKNILANSIPAEGNRYLEDKQFADFDNLVNYSIKYLGCYRWFNWNEDANGDEDLRLNAKRVVSYRLCPSNSCSDSSDNGCKSNYGEYIVDMSLFLENYFDAMMEVAQNENGDDGGYANYAQYAYCNKFNQNRDTRELNYYDVLNDDNIFANDYYLGPYCTDAGISVGLFKDDTCTMVAGGGETQSDNDGSYVYEKLTYGGELPFKGETIVSRDCFKCAVDGQNGELNEFCDQMYESSGKCEQHMNKKYPNNYACNFIAGLPTLKYGFYGGDSHNSTADGFIVFFFFASVGLGVYVWYLYKKLNPNQVYFYD